MSEKEEKIEETETDEKEEDIVETNVALLQARLLTAERLNAEKDALIEQLTTKLEQATDFMESQAKSNLIAEIKPRTSINEGILAAMSREDLEGMKRTLDFAVVPAFKSSAPLPIKDRSPRAKLNSMYDEFMGKTYGDKR